MLFIAAAHYYLNRADPDCGTCRPGLRRPQILVGNSDDVLATLGTDVLGSPLDELLVIAVLTSAAASCQTTILPTARTSLSMAFKAPLPGGSATSTPAT